MRILLLTPECPLPLLNGIRLRNFHLFSRLARQQQVTLLSFASEEEERTLPALRSVFSEVHLVRRPYRRSLGDCARDGFSTVPFFVKRMRSADMERKVKKLVQTETHDIAYASDIRMAHYLVAYTKPPKVIDACDCLSMLYRRAFFSARAFSEKIRYLQLWLKTAAYERRMYPEFDRCVVVSQVDGEALRSSSSSLSYTVVPNGVDTEYFHPSATQLVDKNSFIFVGVLDYLPNVDAARLFATQVLPKIVREVPGASFKILGRAPVRQVLDLQSAGNVEVIRDVDDIRPYLWRSAVFVGPLRIGAGVKNKVLEAMAMGKAIVATSVACEGLQVSHGAEVLIADDPTDFAKRCVQLLKDESGRNEMGARARLLAEQKYPWRVGVERLEETLAEVVQVRERRQMITYQPV